MHRQIHRLHLFASAIVMMCQPGCQSITGPLPPEEETVLPVSDEALILTTMNFEEAKRLTPNQLEMPPYFKVAAEKIDVVKADAVGTPLRVRAKGKVYLEVAYSEPARILCHEAYLSEDEVIVRGRPILQRGGSMIEGVDEYTVFYLYGRKVRVIGNHRVITDAQLGAAHSGGTPESGGSSPNGGLAIPYRPSPLPRGPWSMGPNPLLPPLSPTDVPASVRRELRGSDLPPAEDDDPLNPGPLMAPMPTPGAPPVEMKEPRAETAPPKPEPKPAEAKKEPQPKK